MPLPIPNKKAKDLAYEQDIASRRRVELQLSSDCLMTLQYFPEFDNISLSFYTQDLPGFTIGLPTKDWPAIQAMIRDFQWRGRRQ
jgi:hypothetical protein